jgi:hypothetical protein
VPSPGNESCLFDQFFICSQCDFLHNGSSLPNERLQIMESFNGERCYFPRFSLHPGLAYSAGTRERPEPTSRETAGSSPLRGFGMTKESAFSGQG